MMLQPGALLSCHFPVFRFAMNLTWPFIYFFFFALWICLASSWHLQRFWSTRCWPLSAAWWRWSSLHPNMARKTCWFTFPFARSRDLSPLSAWKGACLPLFSLLIFSSSHPSLLTSCHAGWESRSSLPLAEATSLCTDRHTSFLSWCRHFCSSSWITWIWLWISSLRLLSLLFTTCFSRLAPLWRTLFCSKGWFLLFFFSTFFFFFFFLFLSPLLCYYDSDLRDKRLVTLWMTSWVLWPW